MAREVFNLQEAARHVHLEPNVLRHFAQRGEIEAWAVGGEWRFEHRALDEWAQRNLLAATERELHAQHRMMLDEERRERHAELGIAGQFRAEAIDLELRAKTKAGVLRDMAELATRTGLVYDPDGLFRELQYREAAASTAIGGGVALLHPRFHDPYMFEESFIAYGRSANPVFFGAPDDEGTHHFFVICSTDHERHLHVLAHLAVLVHGSDFLAQLDAAESVEAVMAAVAAAEAPFGKGNG